MDQENPSFLFPIYAAWGPVKRPAPVSFSLRRNLQYRHHPTCLRHWYHQAWLCLDFGFIFGGDCLESLLL